MNKQTMISVIAAMGLSALMAAPAVRAQANGNQTVVPLSHPSQPATLKVETLHGSITVQAYNGKSVIIRSSDGRGNADDGQAPPEAQGMHRLSTNGGLSAEEDNNVVTVHTSVFGGGDLRIEVPTDTSVSLHTVSGGKIEVVGVHGDINAENTNGNIVLEHVSGSIVASALNGRVTAVVDALDANKPSSFSSLNGTLDITLPAGVKANLKLRTARGDIYMDNGFQFHQTEAPTATGGKRNDRGMYKVQVDRTITGTLNGGGPEVSVRDFNGDIYIRKGK